MQSRRLRPQVLRRRPDPVTSQLRHFRSLAQPYWQLWQAEFLAQKGNPHESNDERIAVGYPNHLACFPAFCDRVAKKPQFDNPALPLRWHSGHLGSLVFAKRILQLSDSQTALRELLPFPFVDYTVAFGMTAAPFPKL